MNTAARPQEESVYQIIHAYRKQPDPTRTQQVETLKKLLQRRHTLTVREACCIILALAAQQPQTDCAPLAFSVLSAASQRLVRALELDENATHVPSQYRTTYRIVRTNAPAQQLSEQVRRRAREALQVAGGSLPHFARLMARHSQRHLEMKRLAYVIMPVVQAAEAEKVSSYREFMEKLSVRERGRIGNVSPEKWFGEPVVACPIRLVKGRTSYNCIPLYARKERFHEIA